MAGVLMERENLNTETWPEQRCRETHREDGKDGRGAWRAGAMPLQAKEHQRSPVNHQKLERDKEGFPCRWQRECGPDDSWF